MKLTQEQSNIVESTGDLKINAVAGSGKTTTVVEYAKAQPSSSRILYLAFNKSVKLEAIEKFQATNLTNVRVETAHSLAYKHIVFKYGYKVRRQGLKTQEIVEHIYANKDVVIEGKKVKQPKSSEQHSEYIIANHVNKFIAYFCSSNQPRFRDLDYLDIVNDDIAKSFVTSVYDTIETQARLLLARMNNKEIDITHDFYLKKFQLLNPILNFDTILFDEGQDASPAMLDIFLKQKAVKVIVGDTHQQIYGWRHAVNSLEKTDFKSLRLTASFRFGQGIADLAMGVLKWKNYHSHYLAQPIVGSAVGSTARGEKKGQAKQGQVTVKAILARTNLGLLLKAIEYVIEKKLVTKVFFEGNFNSYTYADEGASLYDILSLYNGKPALARDAVIKKMTDLDELEDYVKKTEDIQLGLMMEIVKEYGNKIPDILKKIKSLHVNDKSQAEMIFSTVHRCKGMEYEDVEIVEDFISETKLKNLKSDKNTESVDIAKTNEEINLLYVAITRTRNNLKIPQNLVPYDFLEGFQKGNIDAPKIQIIPSKKESTTKKANRMERVKS